MRRELLKGCQALLASLANGAHIGAVSGFSPRFHPLALLLPAAVAFAAYANTLGAAFVWDDQLLISQNRALASLSALVASWSEPFWSTSTDESALGSMVGASYYRPLVQTLLYLVHSTFGSNPAPYHLMLVLAHALTSVLVAVWAKQLFKRLDAAVAAGCLFAAHPIHTESVAWVSDISDVAMALFGLAAVVLATSERPLTNLRTVGLALLLFASSASKEPGVLAGVVVVLACFTLPHVHHAKREWSRRVVAVAVAEAVYLGLRWWAMRGTHAPLNHPRLGWSGWVLHGLSLFGQAVTALVAPAQLNAFHVLHRIDSPLTPRVVGGASLALSLVLLLRWAWSRVPLLRLPLSLLLVSLLPGTLVPRLGRNPFAERYLYWPSVGFAIVLGAGVVWAFAISTRAGRLSLAVSALAVMLGLAAIVERNIVWQNNVTLFTDMGEQTPGSAMVRENLSQGLLEAGRPNEALALLANHADLTPGELLTRGIAYAATRRFPEAIATFDQALALVEGGHQTLTEGLLLTNRCLAEQHQKQWPAALETCRRAVELVPFLAQARAIHSRALMFAGRRDEALDEARRAIELDSANRPAQTMIKRLQTN